MQISIKDLSFRYNKKDKDVIRNLSLIIPSNKISILLGINGSGKTTLLKNIAGLLKPTKGKVCLGNTDLGKIKIHDRSKKISYVSQKIEQQNGILVRDYLSFSLCNQIKFGKTPSIKQIMYVESVAKKFGISNLLDKTLESLSGGQQQVVCICGAIIQNTDIILLDEPTSALDLKNQKMILDILKRLSKKDKKTIIFTSHNPNHALYLDSNVALLSKGEIYKQGAARDTIKIDTLKKIYGNSVCYAKDKKYREITIK